MNHITEQQLDNINRQNEEAAFSPNNIFGPNGYGVPRILPPAPPRPRRTWEQLVSDARQIRRNYLKARGWL